MNSVLILIVGLTIGFTLASVPRWAPSLRTNRRAQLFGIAALFVIPLLVFIVYAVINEPTTTMIEKKIIETPASTQNAPPIENLVDGLAERLQREPNDAQGWMLLARSYLLLNRFQDANAAYQQAKDLGVQDTSFEEELSRSPNITSVHAETTEQAPENLVSVSGLVTLDPQLENKVNENNTVFIFVRSDPPSGAPLAIEKISVRDLPYSFSLDDRNAMTTGTHLADHMKITLVARVSKSGDALDQTMGLEASSGVIALDQAHELKLIIGSVKQP